MKIILFCTKISDVGFFLFFEEKNAFILCIALDLALDSIKIEILARWECNVVICSSNIQFYSEFQI